MTATSLEFLILAKDQASEAFEKVSSAVDRQRDKLDKLKAVGTIAAAALVAGVAKFSSDSVEAYSEAERKQALLTDAFKKFPALGDTNIAKLNELNDAIQRKTGYDNDDLAASQAKLAVYGLTGAQIAQLTPLVADYAAKTGKDLPTAAEAVGKAMLGQGRALKDVGINFHDTKTVAGNFGEILDGLKSKIGGTADAMGNTATGKVQILSKSYEDLQEKVGSMLVPVLTTLVGVGQTVMDWMQKNPAIVTALAIVIGVLAVALTAVAIAMGIAAVAENALLWPVLLIVVAIAALIAVIVLLATHWSQITAFITDVWNKFTAFLMTTLKQMGADWNATWNDIGNRIKNIWQGFVGWVTGVYLGFTGTIMSIGNTIQRWWNSFWTAIGDFIKNVWNNDIIAPIRTAWDWIKSNFQRGLSVIGGAWNALWGGFGGVVRNAFNGVMGSIQGTLNGIIGMVNGAIGAVNSVGGAVGIHIGTIPTVSLPHFAAGTNYAPGGLSLVGENGPELMNVPRGASITPNGQVATVRLHPDDMQTLGGIVYSLMMSGAQKSVRTALGV